MVKALALDTETTTYNNGNPYDSRNSLVCFSSFSADSSFKGAYPANRLTELKEVLDIHHPLIVGFNFKFDYHWFTKVGLDLSSFQIWDVQIAEFILSHQTLKLSDNSLNKACERYSLPRKLDVVKTEYWDKGIQTDEIPWHILSEYAAHDAYVTYQCYLEQLKRMTPAQKRLCMLMCMDMHVLREMEGNGLLFDEQLCRTRSVEVDDQISTIKRKLSAIYPNVPINFNSGDHLSAFLYGGVVKEDGKEHVGFYKTGDKAGQPKYKNVEYEHVLPQLYKPLPGSALEKEGMYATDIATLKKLKGKKDTLSLLLELSKLEKKNGTYYKGLPLLREKMNWPENFLHGQFNQCIAATGRLSSSKPNLQNFDSELQDIFISKFDD